MDAYETISQREPHPASSSGRLQSVAEVPHSHIRNSIPPVSAYVIVLRGFGRPGPSNFRLILICRFSPIGRGTGCNHLMCLFGLQLPCCRPDSALDDMAGHQFFGKISSRL
jgi:hypothetical protein